MNLFRTTHQTQTNQSIRFVSNYTSNIARLQRDISSGVKVHRASDNPVSFRQISILTSQLEQLESESSAIVDAEAKLNTSVATIQQVHDLIVRAQTIAQQGIQATNESEKNALAVEVEGLFDSLKNISQTQASGDFLYSGARSSQPPYVFGDPLVEGRTSQADYQGAKENSYAYIGTRIAVETLYSGEELFSASNREELLVFGNTGAKNGAGTDSMVGRAALLVQHALTNYAGSSGIQPGASSVGSDTVIGMMGENQLTLTDSSGTGDFGTVSLNGGPEVNWNQADGDLEVVGGDGRKVYVDTRNITAGFSGSVDLASDGTLSVDGGATKVPIDFSSSQTIVDSLTGEQTHIDTSRIDKTGTDHLEFPGTSNVFQVFHELIADLRNSRDLDGQGFSQALDRRLGELDRLADNSLNTLGRQSASLLSLQELEYRVEDITLESKIQINEFQATDIPEAVLQMQSQQSLLEFTYTVTAQINSTGILDFLR
jgi:flagellin-like hook-associated protein FlgL